MIAPSPLVRSLAPAGTGRRRYSSRYATQTESPFVRDRPLRVLLAWNVPCPPWAFSGHDLLSPVQIASTVCQTWSFVGLDFTKLREKPLQNGFVWQASQQSAHRHA